MRHPAAAIVLAVLALALTPSAASAADPVTEEFRTALAPPWHEVAFGGNPDVVVRGGVVTVGPENIVVLNQDHPNDWAGTSSRTTGWTVDFRMRLGADATRTCQEPNGSTPPTLLWVGDTSGDVLQLGFAPGELCLFYPDQVTVPLDTQRWHRYRLTALGQHVTLAVDGRTVVDRTLERYGAGSLGIYLETHEGHASWDQVTYDTSPGNRCTVRGTPGDDVLVGTWRRDVICGGDGNDVLRGLGGDDVLLGGLGDDTLVGGPGDDLLQGGWGDDELDGRSGDDTVEGGTGDDRILASEGPDGADVLIGGPGRDTVDYSARTGGVTLTLGGEADDGAPGEGDSVGGPLNPWLRSTDVEELVGGSGDDTIVGWSLPETLVGGPGADVLRGGEGQDDLRGQDGVAGNDRLDGEGSTDVCTADAGDTLVSCNDPDPRPTFTMPPPPPVTPSPGASAGSVPSLARPETAQPR